MLLTSGASLGVRTTPHSLVASNVACVFPTCFSICEGERSYYSTNLVLQLEQPQFSALPMMLAPSASPTLISHGGHTPSRPSLPRPRVTAMALAMTGTAVTVAGQAGRRRRERPVMLQASTSRTGVGTRVVLQLQGQEHFMGVFFWD